MRADGMLLCSCMRSPITRPRLTPACLLLPLPLLLPILLHPQHCIHNTSDKEAAAATPEWKQLPPALQEELTRAFVERRRSDVSDAATAAAAGLAVVLGSSAPGAAAEGPLQPQQPLQPQRTLLLPHAAMHEVGAAAAGFASLLQHVEGASGVH